MAVNSNIRTIILNVHLGDVPTFDLRADEDVNAYGSECRFSGTGTGRDDAAWLRELLGKLSDAYGKRPAISLCVGPGDAIMPDAKCP